VPSTIGFNQIDTDTFAKADGGGKLTSKSQDQARIRIDADNAGVFSVVSVDTLHIVRGDPDAPHSKPSWQTLQSFDGSGPFSLSGAEALDIVVGFASPKKPQQTSFSATAVVVLQDANATQIMQVPIKATVDPVGRIRIVTAGSSVLTGGMAAGQTAPLDFQFNSTLDQDISGTLARTVDGLPFSAPVQPVTIPARGIVRVSVPLTCAPDTSFGRFENIGFHFDSADPAGKSGIAVSIEVLAARTVSVTTNLPQNLVLDTDNQTLCKVTIQDSGGASEIVIKPGVVPPSVAVDIGTPRTIAQGAGGQFPPMTLEVDINIRVVPPVSFGPPSPLVLNWTVPADSSGPLIPPSDSHPEVDGNIVFNCRVAPVASVMDKIRDFHRRTGADYGPLGVPLGGLTLAADGSFQQNYQLGNVRVADLEGAPTGQTTTVAEVTLSAVKCFGTQDSDGSDSPYAVISLVDVNPNHASSDQLVKTLRTDILNDVHAHPHDPDALFKMQTLGEADPSGGGITIHVALWDHESGNADDIRDQIQSALEDAVKQSATALASAAGVDDPAVTSGTIGDILEFEVAGIKPFHILTLGIAGAIANALADDLIGEQTFFIPAANITDFADQNKFIASIRQSPDLPFDVQLNWPPKPAEEPIFTDGHATYKVYFLIAGKTQDTVLTPALK
jgi:hypothetical protein